MENLSALKNIQPLPRPIAQAVAVGFFAALAFFVTLFVLFPPELTQEWALAIWGYGAWGLVAVVSTAGVLAVLAAGIPVAFYLIRKFNTGLAALDDAMSAPVTRSLPAGEIPAGDIILSSASPNETGEQLWARFEEAERANPNRVIVVLPYKSQKGYIHYSPEKSGAFDCENDGEGWPDFVAYISQFAKEWRENILRESLDHAKDATVLRGNFAQLLRNGVLVFALVFAANFAAFSQTKSAQVQRYLGARYEMKAPAGEVVFRFEKASLSRMSSGAKTYGELLTAAPAFTNDDNAGKLLRITVAGAAVPVATPIPAPKPEGRELTEQELKDLVRPIADDGTKKPAPSFSLPDSIEFQRKLDGAEGIWTKLRQSAWRLAQPLWKFVMDVFSGMIVLFICAGGILRYIAGSASGEAVMNVHGRAITGKFFIRAHLWASSRLIVITWCVAIVVMVDIFMWLIYLNITIWLMLFLWAPVIWVAEKLTNWVVPNVPMVGGHGVMKLPGQFQE